MGFMRELRGKETGGFGLSCSLEKNAKRRVFVIFPWDK